LTRIIPPTKEITISIGNLRVKLIEHGLPEEVMTQCENIMLAEFSDVNVKLQVMQNQCVALLEQMRLLKVLCASTCFQCDYLVQVPLLVAITKVIFTW
jgi:ABC-type uncharacterized transport system permease subunit